MRKKLINILLLIMVLCFTLILGNNVQATEEQSGVFSLSSSQVNLKEGDTFEVDIKIDSLNGFSGIRSFIARKVYDAEVFEYQGTEAKNGWELKGDDKKIVLTRDEVTGSGVIAALKFKVLKADLESTIQLTEIDAAGDDGDVYYDDNNVNEPTIKLKIEEATPPTEQPTDPPTEQPTEKPTDPPTEQPTEKPTDPPTEQPTEKPTEPPTEQPNEQPTEQPGNNKPGNTGNTGTTKPTNNDKTTAQNKIPQTGENSVLIILISLAAVMAVVVFIKYKVYSKNIK